MIKKQVIASYMNLVRCLGWYGHLCEIRKVEGSMPGRFRSKTEKWHLLHPWLTFTILELEQDWLTRCQYNVTRRGIMLILWCGTSMYWHNNNTRMEFSQYRQVLHPLSYRATNVNPFHSLGWYGDC